MGYFSDKAIEQNEDFNLSGLNKTICYECVKDKYLAKVILENSVSKKCSYCDKKFRSKKAATYNFIMNKIYQTIFNYYGNADNLNIPFDEGEWVVGSTSIEDVLFEINPGWDDNFSIDLANSADPWLYLVKHSKGDWLEIPESETLLYSWDSFKNQILYKTRYLFLNEPNDDFADNQIIPVSSMLNALEKLCIELNLIKTVKKNSFFYRVRSHSKEESFSEFDHMGVAPLRIATAGRMNPAGIPYFYIADSSLTAKLEVIKDQEHWSCAKFKLKKDIEVIDFSYLPEIPSIFEIEKYENRQKIIFLHDLVEDMSKPVGPDEKDHIDYIPTQVVSEFFRYRFKPIVKGIKYRSVKNPKGLNIAFFESENKKIKEFFELINIEKN
ncbi:RES domain-containing protein [Acinetobacter baumannii]|uniref:HEPN-associated N-terminal domain-containing protein n=2 Tax=Acinetobacter baumannii TaxID=470 RepID=UPI0023401128|nr:HEPN-associated N-terminal domain-containing protein [Acinetobacter baumannii]MDC4413849.1 RES domain-containing protein [Acinetobacter baumannii]MDC5521564.1 RES domain-containing protein [Acinetobacter baumannii]MDV7468502.1 RES domain-containing protein [Acinetobacter baumannii]